jgi:hypothetical protein
MSEQIRARWNAYFNSKNVNHMFFSAKKELIKINENEANVLLE